MNPLPLALALQALAVVLTAIVFLVNAAWLLILAGPSVLVAVALLHAADKRRAEIVLSPPACRYVFKDGGAE